MYKVGRDIPAGVFDFHHVWGNGSIHVYKAEEMILRNLTFGDNIGDTYVSTKRWTVYMWLAKMAGMYISTEIS